MKMKKILKKQRAMNCKNLRILLPAILISLAASSQSGSETRNYIKSFRAGKETTLEVYNKYGTVQVTQWKKDSVLVRGEIKAFASDREKLENMFDDVNINIEESKYTIRAETGFTKNISRIFENFKGMTSKFISYDTRVEINYYITVPEYINMSIENKYGDVYLENNTGDLSITLSNGSFKANSLGKNASLNLSFCDATVHSMASGNIDASFSELSFDDIGDMKISSISSKYNIRKAGMIDAESKRDKFYIDDISVMKGDAYFTDFNLKYLKKEVSLSTRYGNISIDMVSSRFESINLKTGYTDVTLDFEPGSSYNVDIRHLNAFVVISDKNARTDKKVLNEDKKEYITSGSVGREPSTSKVTIDATHGDIYLK
jgi:hypothetical protein